LMMELHAEYPAYGFDRHKGYPTAEHRAVLLSLGPCPAHRRSFAPVRAALNGSMPRSAGSAR
jgi:ribonuclease HII